MSSRAALVLALLCLLPAASWAKPELVGMWAVGAGPFSPARIDRVHFALRLEADGAMTLWRRMRYTEEDGSRRGAITETDGIYTVRENELTLIDSRGNTMQAIRFVIGERELTLIDGDQKFRLRRVY